MRKTALWLLPILLTGCMPRLCAYGPGEPPRERPVALPSSAPLAPSLNAIGNLDSDRLFRFIRRRNPWLEEALARQISAGILTESERHAIDPRLVAAVISVESSFNPKAVSPTGAKGLGQFLSSTAKDVGISDPFDVDQGVRGTARYISWLCRAWDGYPQRLELAIVSYSSGIGTVQRQLKKNQPLNGEQQKYLEAVRKMLQALDKVS